MDDTGLSWQQRLGDWWQDDKRGCVKRLVWKVKNSATGSSGAKTRRGGCRAHECGRGQKSSLWAQTLGWPLIGDVLSQTGSRCRVPISG